MTSASLKVLHVGAGQHAGGSLGDRVAAFVSQELKDEGHELLVLDPLVEPNTEANSLLQRRTSFLPFRNGCLKRMGSYKRLRQRRNEHRRSACWSSWATFALVQTPACCHRHLLVRRNTTVHESKEFFQLWHGMAVARRSTPSPGWSLSEVALASTPTHRTISKVTAVRRRDLYGPAYDRDHRSLQL